MKKSWLFPLLGWTLGMILLIPLGCGDEAGPDAVITGPSDGDGYTVPGYLNVDATYSLWVGPLQFNLDTADTSSSSSSTTATAKRLSKAVPGAEMTFVVTGDFDVASFSTIRFVDGMNVSTFKGNTDVISFSTNTNDAGVARVFVLARVTCGGGATDRTVQMGVEAYTASDLAAWDSGGITVQCTAPASS